MADLDATRSLVISEGDSLSLTFERTRLLVEAGPDAGKVLPLTDRPVVIGRGEDTDLRLTDGTISRRHLVLEPDGKGWRVRDLGSKTGVRIEGVEVNDAPLPLGANLALGETTLVLKHGQETVRAPPEPEAEFGDLIGESPAMRSLFGLTRKVAPLDLPVLVHGESGAGKEGIARALHSLGTNPDGPFEVVDCTLLEAGHARSELFGHVKGAFTGAEGDRDGALVRADGGTLFFDEIGELPLDVQATLLRALQSGDVRPLGAEKSKQVKVRVVSATHRDLPAMAAEGKFREDLYYRLSAITLEVPPLRARPGDPGRLAEAFLPAGVTLTDAALRAIEAYPWPGNVRELEFKMARAGGLCEGGRITPADLGLDGGGPEGPAIPGPAASAPAAPVASAPSPGVGTMEEMEEHALREALALYDGNRNLAARHLGIGRSTLFRKLKKYGIS